MILYTILRPSIGFIAGFLFYIIILSGLIQGDLFPHIRCTYTPSNKQPEEVQMEDCKTFNHLFELRPGTSQDYAKFLVWRVICGFSERFVPDILESFTRNNS